MNIRTKLFAFVFLLAVLFVSSKACCSGTDTAHSHRATHTIYLNTVLDRGTKCSATAIFPHALLIASHCEVASDKLVIDNVNYKLFGAPIRDGMDHSIFLVNATFTVYAKLGSKPLDIADDIYIFGNPGTDSDIYRKGYVAGVRDSSPFIVLFDLNGYKGDSGAAVFNKDGEVVGVISMRIMQSEEGDTPFVLMGGFPISFTAAQLSAAADFVPPPAKAGDRVPITIGAFDGLLKDKK